MEIFDKHKIAFVYLGKVKHHDEVYPGEHAAIVDEQIWQRVQSILSRNSRTGGAQVKNKYGALLKGLLHCGSCNCSMGHSYTTQGNTRYPGGVAVPATH